MKTFELSNEAANSDLDAVSGSSFQHLMLDIEEQIVKRITFCGLAKYRLAEMLKFSTKTYWRYFAKPLL